MAVKQHIAVLVIDLSSPFSEGGYMATPRMNRLAAIRKAQGLTQQQLGDAVGAHWITISKLERGKMQMTFTWLEKLSIALGVFPAELLSDEYASPEINLTAEIIDTRMALVRSENVSVKTYPYSSNEEDSLWVRCSDESLRPHFRKGDLIKFVRIAEYDIGDHVGRITLVSNDDFTEMLFGIVEIAAIGVGIEIRRFNATTIRDYKPKHAWLASEIKYYLVSRVDTL